MTAKFANLFAMIKALYQNPWGGPWGGQGGNQGPKQGPWGKPEDKNKDGEKPNNNPGNGQGKKLNPNFDDKVDEAVKRFKNLFNEQGGSYNNKGMSKNSRSIFGLFLSVLLVLWLASGIYKIDSDENGLVLYFGKFYSVSTPGLNYCLPAPFCKVIKKKVTRVNTEEFGFSSGGSKMFGGKSKEVVNTENLMLTGDENIVDIDFQVQWQISDIKDFIFNLEDPELGIRKASESAMREIIARTPIADALSDGKNKIEQETKVLLQEILDSYGAGVRVVLVQMRRVDPPAQVIDAFRDVQTARADKEKEINQAQSYSNDIIPRARGEASKIIESAKAYKQEVVANAQGQASRFNAIYNQYAKSKAVTKKRMYFEQMEKTYRDIDKVIIDKNISKTGAIPYLPISTTKAQTTTKKAE
ncbi:MAG: hflK [Rickettsiaceae bacterium]|jgi:membrane protease subunit HflK|nr:hflK [Rickettsiaceae bacterium]